jgi:hypothetical protein
MLVDQNGQSCLPTPSSDRGDVSVQDSVVWGENRVSIFSCEAVYLKHPRPPITQHMSFVTRQV